MRPLLVVFAQPVFGDRAHLVDRLEHVRIEHLIAIGLVEGFDERVLVRLAGLDEAQLDSLFLTPLGEGDRGELAAIVQTQRLGLAIQFGQLLHHADHAQARNRVRHFDAEHFAIAFVDDVEGAEGA